MNISPQLGIFFIFDTVWFLSGIVIIFLILFTILSLIILARYIVDKRRHFYPLQFAILVLSGTLIICDLVFVFTGHRPPAPLFSISSTTVRYAAIVCFLVGFAEVVYMRRLPLTKNQRRYRKMMGR